MSSSSHYRISNALLEQLAGDPEAYIDLDEIRHGTCPHIAPEHRNRESQRLNFVITGVMCNSYDIADVNSLFAVDCSLDDDSDPAYHNHMTVFPGFITEFKIRRIYPAHTTARDIDILGYKA